MGECKLDHTLVDVQNKLSDQSAFMPSELAQAVALFLHTNPSQAVLNELFHLLKKYDLATAEEQRERNHKLQGLIK